MAHDKREKSFYHYCYFTIFGHDCRYICTYKYNYILWIFTFLSHICFLGILRVLFSTFSTSYLQYLHSIYDKTIIYILTTFKETSSPAPKHLCHLCLLTRKCILLQRTYSLALLLHVHVAIQSLLHQIQFSSCIQNSLFFLLLLLLERKDHFCSYFEESFGTISSSTNLW